MKRKRHVSSLIIIASIVMLMSFTFVASDTHENQQELVPPEAGSNIGQNPGDIARSAANAAVDSTKKGLFGIGANQSAIIPIYLPEELNKIFGVAFGVQEGLTLDKLIIMVALFVIAYFLLFQLVFIFLDRESTSIIASLFATGLLSYFGVLYGITLFLFGVINEIAIPQVRTLAYIIVAGILIFVVGGFIIRIIKGFRRTHTLEEKERMGVVLGRMARVAKWRMKKSKSL